MKVVPLRLPPGADLRRALEAWMAERVEDGQAFAYRRYLNGCDAKEYLAAEFRASRHRYGLWQVEGGITRPWDFRRGSAAAVIPDGTTPGGRRYRCKEIGSYTQAQELRD